MLCANKTAKIVVGASLGGFAAILALADQHLQESIAGLVLVDVVPAPDPDRVRSFLAPMMENEENAFFVENILAKSDLLLSATAKLRLPLLLVRADRNGAIQDEEISKLRSLCPQLTVGHIENASHLVARDTPIDLAKHLLHFEQSYEVRQRKYNSRRDGDLTPPQDCVI